MLWGFGALILGATAATAAIAVVLPNRRASRPVGVAEELERFHRNYGSLRDRQDSIGDDLLLRSPKTWRNSSVPMFTDVGWILQTPRELGVIDIRLEHANQDITKIPKRSRLIEGLSLKESSAIAKHSSVWTRALRTSMALFTVRSTSGLRNADPLKLRSKRQSTSTIWTLVSRA